MNLTAKGIVQGKGSQIYGDGDGRRFDFEWYKHNAVHR